MSAPSRERAVSMSSGKTRSSAARSGKGRDNMINTPPLKNLRLFDPCAATGAMLLYAQGSSIVCCHHDTLTIERRFSRHADEVLLLAVDNQSELGAGRLVVSYDASQTAIVWDLMTGDEVARFASFEHLTAASWMKNGNVAFGNAQGSIILFEPETSEHISSRTLDQIAVTSLAPSADCRTFAIGYQNGSLLIATLQPRFTILHSLEISRGPSPVVTLAWHASSSKQKSDMLAVQTYEGDLRVWSVSKSYNAEDPAKIVRILKKSESPTPGPNWMGWSKNGRVIQYADSQTLSWDVRTKHVTRDAIPTLEQVKGLALYGPGATLFTLGPGNTVQQFDLNAPSIMVANVQHPPNLLPPSPPNSIEEPSAGDRSATSATTINTSESDASSIPVEMNVSESDDDHLSPFARLSRQRAIDSGNEASYDSASPISSRSGVSSLSKSSAGSRTPGRHAGSLRSRGMTEHTYISAGSSLKSSTIGKREVDTYSMGYTLPSTSMASSSRSKQRPSRLRHEVPRSPDDSIVHDLFKFTRTRLSDIPYKHPSGADNSRLTNDDLRRQMLSTVFGWHKEVDDLIRDELSRHPPGSKSRILLAKWLGDIDVDIMSMSSQNMSSSDWMLLALSGVVEGGAQHKIGRAFVQRLLESGDVHAAVTIMLGMGDHNDAIEVYISHKKYMEALLLTCLSYPEVWERQAAIIRKWGEWAVQHGQQQLAIRCFACTDQESTEPWTSPSAAQLNFKTITTSIPEVLSPPLSPPGFQRGPQRSIAKSSALKLITSFGDQSQKSKFYSQGDGGQTPIAAGVTPIAESAVSPGASFDATTALLRPSNNSRFNTPTSARAGGSSYGRGRLPSIGEIPSDLNRKALEQPQPPTPPVDGRGHVRMSSAEQENLAVGIALQRAATASPMMMRDRFEKVVRVADDHPVAPDQNAIDLLLEQSRNNRRNGSRDRIPRGVNLAVRTEAPDAGDVTSPEQSGTSSNRFHWPSRRARPGPGSVASSITSNSSAGRSHRNNARARDDYIHSLDTAQFYNKKTRSRPSSNERKRESSRGRQGSKERRAKSREASEERGRANSRTWHKPKRSPTSPIPMSPEDLAQLGTPRFSEVTEPSTVRKASISSRALPSSRTSSRGSRRRSPDARPRPPALDIRGRKDGRDGSAHRSPSSPLPLSAAAAHYQGSEDEEDFLQAKQAQESFRAKHSRSTSRGLDSPVVSRRERSESRKREALEAIDILPPLTNHIRGNSKEHVGDLRQMKDERQRKKEQAARDLEERRKSLAKRPQAPQIPHPAEIVAPGPPFIGVEAADPKPLPDDLPPRSATEPPKSMYARQGPHIGLPATPKAMRLIMEAEQSGNGGKDLPEIPPIPATFAQRHSPRLPAQQMSPEKEKPEPETLALLPSTVYQPPTRPFIPRSMSAPIPDEPGLNAFARKGSIGEARGIEEQLQNSSLRPSHDHQLQPPLSGRRPSHDGPTLMSPGRRPSHDGQMMMSPGRRPSHDGQMAPPPPPAPPLLKELQHLAMLPPPPPAPLQLARQSQDSAAVSSAMIEIVMDEDDNSGSGETAPVTAAPAIAASGSRHSRGRSHGDGSGLAGRFSKATERLRSASRGRREAARSLKSPSVDSPYESVPHLPVKSPHPPVTFDPDTLRSPIEGPAKHDSTGLHHSEMF